MWDMADFQHAKGTSKDDKTDDKINHTGKWKAKWEKGKHESPLCTPQQDVELCTSMGI
jgi:hypothetical protein